ncbi:hypothetical protein DL546_003699 [Coniochaeta pulveracea]|uniref:Transcription factor domain-containing protein n=1 Tax=Coniochaeta pulveracea TaxID=177199 RepID=A0A420Y7C8_9PEZI|nr:hypothetical protein DL546_003699 [Coniochaeta pulveracea]
MPHRTDASRHWLSPTNIVGFVDETSEVSELYTILRTEDVSDGSSKSPKISPDEYMSSFRQIRRPAAEPITDEKEAFYLARYTDIIGPRFDMFDSTSRYFSLVLPHVALKNRLVLLACIASAARQYSLVTNRGHHDALAYYNEAIKALSDRLNDTGHEAATFASCLLIAHCEMVESKASDWYLHLKGTGELVATQNWNGRGGGLAQASFWIYCRMMILASLSSGMPAAVDLGHLLSLSYFPSPPEWTLDTWQSRVVYLLGSVQHFWAKTRNHHPSDMTELDVEWKNLDEQLLRHHHEAPTICQILSITAANQDNPFEVVRYINGPVSAAWQMLHTAHLILTLSRPVSPTARRALLSSCVVRQKALLFARKIVSNSISNRCTIAWANAVQLLTVAGQCLVETKEREACLKALDDIQHHTGWDTRTNMERLSSTWRESASSEEITHCATDTTSKYAEDLGKLLYIVWSGGEDTTRVEQDGLFRRYRQPPIP